MKRQAKVALLVVTTCFALGGVLWMRELASWRPVKVGQIKPRPAVIKYFSVDGRTALLIENNTYVRNFVGAPTAGATSEFEPYHPFIEFSRQSPERAAIIERKGVRGELRVREVGSGRLKRLFHWPIKNQITNCGVLPGHDGKTVSIVDFPLFYEWNMENGQLNRKIILKNSLEVDNNHPVKFATSLDGKRLFGCTGRAGRIWELESGSLLRSWKTQAVGEPILFSPDARVVVYIYNSTTNVQPPSNFVNTSTGRVMWKTQKDFWNSFSSDGSEIALPQKNNCELRDSLTGRILRKLPGPRQSDGLILRVTGSYIYNQNVKREIFRWRAR